MTTYTGPTHERFSSNGGSLRVGPGAWLQGYSGPRLEDKTFVLGPGASIPDLAAVRFDHRVDAFQLVCEDPHAAR